MEKFLIGASHPSLFSYFLEIRSDKNGIDMIPNKRKNIRSFSFL